MEYIVNEIKRDFHIASIKTKKTKNVINLKSKRKKEWRMGWTNLMYCCSTTTKKAYQCIVHRPTFGPGIGP